jgi:hypothetical protein
MGLLKAWQKLPGIGKNKRILVSKNRGGVCG